MFACLQGRRSVGSPARPRLRAERLRVFRRGVALLPVHSAVGRHRLQLRSGCPGCANGCDAAWLVQDAAKDLPPGCGQVPTGCESLSCFEEARVEADGRKDHICQCGAASVCGTGSGQLSRDGMVPSRVP